MLTIILTIVIFALMGVNCLLYHNYRRQKFGAIVNAELYEDASASSVQYRNMYLEAIRRDNVQAYDALEQGTNELVENYESDRLDLLEKIERLEMERDFLLAQTDDAINELHNRLDTYKRAQALHIETILAYQKEKEDKIVLPTVKGE